MTSGRPLIMMQWAFNMMCTTRTGGRHNGSLFYARNKQKLKHSPETIAKCTGSNNGFYGRTHTDELKQKMSKLKKGVPLSEEHRLKIKKNASRSNLGKHLSEETKEKLRIKSKEFYSNKENHPCFGKPKSDITKAKMRVKAKGRLWFNNGEISVSRRKCPDGFKPGRLPRTEEHNKNAGLAHKGIRWYTDGTVDKQIRGDNIPEGFRPGRCLKFKRSESANKASGDFHRGKKWFTNGTQNVATFECPAGFRPGKTHRPK